MDLSSAQELHNNSAEISSFIRRWNHTWPSLAFKIRYILFNALFQPSWTSKKKSPRWVKRKVISRQVPRSGSWIVAFEAQLNGFKVGDEAPLFFLDWILPSWLWYHGTWMAGNTDSYCEWGPGWFQMQKNWQKLCTTFFFGHFNPKRFLNPTRFLSPVLLPVISQKNM